MQGQDFAGAAKRVWLYIYRVKHEATEDMIISFIKSKDTFKNESIVVKEIPGVEGHPKRFVVTAPLSRKDELYDPSFWPQNIGIKRFDFSRHREFLKNCPASFL